MPDDVFRTSFEEALTAALAEMALTHLFPGEAERDRFTVAAAHFASYLAETNRKFNLTAITEPREMAVKHVADSLTALRVGQWPQGAAVCDVGTGGGLPGVVLALARPDLKVTFVDSAAKKLRFVAAACDRLGIAAQFCHDRAEHLGKDPAHRGRYRVVVARAVARMPRLTSLCLPLTAVGGWFVAMKGPDAHAELAEAERDLARWGGVVRQTVELTLPQGAGRRTLIAIERIDTSL